MRLNQLMSKHQPLSKYLHLNCLQIEQLLPNCCPILGIPIISKQSLQGFAFVINGCKLFIIFQSVFKEPIKLVHLQELTNQWKFNGAFALPKINNSFCESNKKCCRITKEKCSNKIKEIWIVNIPVQNSIFNSDFSN